MFSSDEVEAVSYFYKADMLLRCAEWHRGRLMVYFSGLNYIYV